MKDDFKKEFKDASRFESSSQKWLLLIMASFAAIGLWLSSE